MRIRALRALVALLLASGALSTAGAQDPRMGTRLDAPSKAAILAIVDSARAQGIPVEPLMEKVYEGIGKGADGPRIVAAVRAFAQEMASVHKVLGTVASAGEIKAAASAMHAGVPAVELGKMKKQSGLRRSLTLPFTVLADIVSRGVPVQTAANAVRSLVGAGAKDADLNTFQRNVKVDIEQGAPPAAAAETRAKGASPKPDEL
ncbi:MAG: hypothetical protein JWL60_1397 [Gemmatimonadetes bacterium]|jgi:hypothetical protein|nr:hypothetical protein [Gemmatimonadota bacterium]